MYQVALSLIHISCEHTEDYLQLEGITGFEVFNYGCEVEAATGRGYDQYDLWRRLFCHF